MSFIERPRGEASPENIAPAQPARGDWVRAIFRALSMNVFRADTVVDGEDVGIVIDLTTPGVLEAAAGYLAGVTLYPDHNRSVEAWLGRVARSWWSTTEAQLPAGINAEIEVDQVANPKIARGLLAEPPIINACSVGMDFDYEQSHPELPFDQFLASQGETVNGGLVRCIVTNVYPFSELSLVWRGADPTAIKLEEPAPLNLPGARARMRGASRPPKEDGAMKMTTELVSRVRALLGNKAPADLEEKETGDALSLVLSHGEAQASALKTSEAALAALKPEAATGSSMLAELRETVLGVAKFAKLGTAEGELDLATVKVIEAASREDLGVMLKEFEEQGKRRVPLKCAECGSTNVSRRSSVETPPDGRAGASSELAPYDPAAERLSAKYKAK